MNGPTVWQVVEQSLGAVDAVLLGDLPTDDYRLGVTVVSNGDDGVEADVQVVYPCRECGWDSKCGDCHS